MQIKKFLLVTIGICAGLQAYAEESPWTYRVGVTRVDFSASADVKIEGVAVPGGSATASNNDALTFDIGYTVNDEWDARFIFGIPPTTKVSGAGTLPPILLGKVTYAPAILSAVYKFPTVGTLRPYAGAGVNYTRILKSKDSSLSSFDVDHAWAPVVHVGAELKINKDWFVNFDIRKVYLKSDASGFLGPQQVTAKVTLNPLLTSISIGRRF